MPFLPTIIAHYDVQGSLCEIILQHDFTLHRLSDLVKFGTGARSLALDGRIVWHYPTRKVWHQLANHGFALEFGEALKGSAKLCKTPTSMQNQPVPNFTAPSAKLFDQNRPFCPL